MIRSFWQVTPVLDSSNPQEYIQLKIYYRATESTSKQQGLSFAIAENNSPYPIVILLNFDYLGQILKSLNSSNEYLLDSLPVSICDNIRISRSKLVNSEDYRGYIASKKRYFYGIRVQLISTADGIRMEFVFLPGEANDTRGLNALPFNLPSNSIVYCDAGYTDYWAEDEFQDNEAISL